MKRGNDKTWIKILVALDFKLPLFSRPIAKDYSLNMSMTQSYFLTSLDMSTTHK